MAAASGQPQDTSTKKEVTPQQRKLFMGLGAAGLLALLGGGLYFSGILGGGSESAPPTTVAATNAAGASAVPGDPEAAAGTGTGAASGVTPGIDPAAAGAGAPTTASPVSALPQALQRFRSDPFQQAYFIPTPVPTLPPPPPPVFIPAPSDVAPISLPGITGGNATLQRPLNLPPVRIARLDEGTRRPSGAFPPRRTLGGSGGPSGSGIPDPSYDKRLSGVVISDGVRAILETQGPTGPVSRVVQPGDEVDGVTVLNIQRFNDGTKTVTRMLIRENGEERTVELRAGVPIAPPVGQGEGGLAGSPTFPGG